MAEEKALVVLPPQETALDVYSKPGGLDPYIQQIRDAVDGLVYDMSTAKGRDECRSDAFKVARAKTAIEKLGKEVSAKLKEMPKIVDAERKRALEVIEGIQDEVRAPLDAYEAQEAERIAAHKAVIANIAELATGTVGGKPVSIEQRMQLIEGFTVDDSLQEFKDEAASVLRRTREMLAADLARHLKEKADAEELAKLRAEKEAREKKDRDEQIARDAAAKALKDAADKLKEEQDASAKREADAIAAANKAQADLKAAQDKAQHDADAAVERERKSVADAAKLEREAADKRAADTAHRATVNRAALADLVKHCGLDAETAKRVVTKIASGRIYSVSITY